MHIIYFVRMASTQECLHSFRTMYLSKRLCCDMLIFIFCVFQTKVTPLVFRTTQHLWVPLHPGQIDRVATLQCGCGRWWRNCGGDFLFQWWENYKFQECLQEIDWWHITLPLKSRKTWGIWCEYGSSSIMEGFAQNSSRRFVNLPTQTILLSWFDLIVFCVGVYEDDSSILV